MTRVYPNYDYDLAEELVEGIQTPCRVDVVIQKVTEGLQEVPNSEVNLIAKEILGKEGRVVAQKSLDLGQKFKDRTAEVMEEVATKTGIAFPSIPQRYFEIAIICTRTKDKWLINTANTKEFTYSIKNCSIYNGLKSSIPEVITQMPCTDYCYNMSQTIFKGLGIDVKFNHLARMEKDDYCRFQFLIIKGEGDKNEL